MKDGIKEILEDIKEIYYFQPLLDYITNLQEERNSMACLVNDLQEKIDEAIEYIKEKSEEVELNFYGLPDKITSFKGSVSDLLKILKGKSDE